MFFTLRHHGTCMRPERQGDIDLLCIEGDNISEVIQRARYFGINFEEEIGCSCCEGEWWRPSPLAPLSIDPSYRGRNLNTWVRSWLILFKDGNMSSSVADELAEL